MLDTSIERYAQGSPLISLDLIFLYSLSFVFVCLIVYLAFHIIKKPQKTNHFKNFFLVAVIVKTIFVIVIASVAAFYLLPVPKIIKTTPEVNSQNIHVDSKIEIQFDRPVSRQDLLKKITPNVPGIWKFEVGLYKTHFYRKLVFYPDVTFLPEVEYKIELKNIKNLFGSSKSSSYSYSFKTESLPSVAGTSPFNKSTDVATDSKIYINLDKPNNNIAGFNFIIEPKIDFDLKLESSKKSYELTPKEKLKQGTTYKLIITKSRLAKNKNDEVVFRGTEESEISSEFTTKNPPQISYFSPSGDHILTNSLIKIAFSKAMVTQDIQKNISIEPKIKGKISWSSESDLTIIPNRLEYNTNYRITIPKGSRARDTSHLEENSTMEFKTIGPVNLLSSLSTGDNSSNLGVKNSLRFSLDQEVDHKSAEEHFVLDPKVEGTFSWDQNSLTFQPNNPLQYDTNYTVSFNPGIKSAHGQDSVETFKYIFTTESFVFKLTVPAFLQKYALSCEAAALRMMLAYKGVNVDEDTLLNQIGFDSTPRSSGIWGDPYSAFVGDPKGRQMVSGYGVYWDPIARVAKQYRQAQAFTNSSVQDIAKQVFNGNPVQVWIFSKGGTQTSWETPNKKKINAVSGEHTVVVKGFVGKQSDPKQMIINDPLIGEIMLSRDDFETRWNSFAKSGVILM